MKTLAWISYWNYGDSCPISHHVAAFPSDSGDPYKGFEFVNSTQGGDNVLMYGLKTEIQETGMLGKFGEGGHIYRVGYDGKTNQMELLEDVSKTTGIGLGVHTCIYPDGEGFACADGQKDVAAFFTRARGNEKTTVQMAFRADWIPNSPFLGEAWTGMDQGREDPPHTLDALEGARRLRLLRHQGEQDQLRDGTDGRAARGERPAPRRQSANLDWTGLRSARPSRSFLHVVSTDVRWSDRPRSQELGARLLHVRRGAGPR
jgi:hypothetical protein